MKDMLKRLMSTALVCCMLLSGVPSGAFASEAEAVVAEAAVEVPAEEKKEAEAPAEEKAEKKEAEAPAEEKAEKKEAEAPAEEKAEKKEAEAPAEEKAEKKEAEAPAEAEPKKEEPKEEPKQEEPKEEAPATEAPATEAPATEAPATEAPATEAPATEAPATEAPATEVPATEAPATEAPATEAPATEAPATEAPATEAPATEAPATEAPATEAPVTKEPKKSSGPVKVKEVGYIEDDMLYITEAEVVFKKLPKAADYSKIVICEDAKADFEDLKVEFPLSIEEDGILVNGVFSAEIENEGVIVDGEFAQTVTNGKKGVILAGEFEKKIGEIDTKEDIDFEKQYIYGKKILKKVISADMEPDFDVSMETMEIEGEIYHVFGISADLDAKKPDLIGWEFEELEPGTEYAVFAAFMAEKPEWTKLEITIATEPDPEAEEEFVLEEATPEATAEVTPEATVEAVVEATPEVTPEAEVEVIPEVTAEAEAEVIPEVTPEAEAEVIPEVTAEAEVEVIPEVTAEAEVETTPEVSVETTPEVTVEATAEAAVEITPEATAEPTAEVTPEPTPEAVEAEDGLVEVPAEDVFAVETDVLSKAEIADANIKLVKAGSYAVKLSCQEGYELRLEAGDEIVSLGEDGWFRTETNASYNVFVRRIDPQSEWTSAEMQVRPYYINVRLVPENPIEGETVRIVLDTNLPKDAPLVYSWYWAPNFADGRGDQTLIQTGIDADYTTTANNVGCIILASASLATDSKVSGEAATGSVSARSLPPAPSMTFDYEKEEFRLTLQEASKGDFAPAVVHMNGSGSVTLMPESGVTQYVLSLKEFEMQEGKNTFAAALVNSSDYKVYGNSIALERADLSADEIAAANVTVNGQSASCAAGYELRLVDDDGNASFMINGQFGDLENGKSYTLQVRKSGSNAQQRLAGNWADTGDVITAAVPQITVYIAAASALEEILAQTKPGEALSACSSVSDGGYSLPDDVVFTWYRIDENGAETKIAEGDGYTVTEEDLDCSIRLAMTSAAEGWSIGSDVVPVLMEQVSVLVDYEAETVTVTLNEKGEWNAQMSIDQTAYASGSNTITAALSRLKNDTADTKAEVKYSFTRVNRNETISGSIQLPARPEFRGSAACITAAEAAASSVRFSWSDPFVQPGLADENGAYFWADGSGQASGLKPDSNYKIVLRSLGSNADARFASRVVYEADGAVVATKPAMGVEISVSETAANGSAKAYTATVSGANAGNLNYSWHAVDFDGSETLIKDTGSENSITLTDSQKKALFFKRVKVIVRDAGSGNLASDTCETYHADGLAGSFNYERETLTIIAPAVVNMDCTLHMGDRSYAWPSGTSRLAVKLGDFNLPASSAGSLKLALMEEESGMQTKWMRCSVPARPELDASAIKVSASNGSVQITNIPDGYAVGLSQSGSGIGEELEVVDGRASGVIPDQGKPCYVNVEIPASNSKRNFASRMATLKVIPASFSFVLKVKDAETGEVKALDYGMYANLGDLLMVSFDGDYASLSYRWFRDGVEIPGANEAAYQTTADDLNCMISVEVVQKTDSCENTGTDSAEVANIRFGIEVDYAGERLIFTAPCALGGDWMLKVGKEVKWPDGEASAAFTLKELGINPEGSGSVSRYNLISGNSKYPSAGFEQFNLPNRVEYTGEDASVKECRSTSVVLNDLPENAEAALSVAGAGEPNLFPDANNEIHGLLAGVEYQLWTRSAATQSAFASKWRAVPGTVSGTMAALDIIPEAKIDFINETLVITAPRDIPEDSIHEWIAGLDINGAGLTGKFEEGKYTRTLTLARLELPHNTRDTQGYVYLETGSEADNTLKRSQSLPVTIPARPAFSGDIAQLELKKTGATANSLSFSCAPGYEVVLKGAWDYIYPDGPNSFTGLDYGTEYKVYVRNVATESSFASVPAPVNVAASTLSFKLEVDRDSVAVGETITASVDTDGVNYPDMVFSWYIQTAKGLELVASGVYCVNYTPTAADVGKKLVVEVTCESIGMRDWIVAAEVTEVAQPTATATIRPTATPTATPRPTATHSSGGSGGGSYVTPRPTATPTVTPRPTATPTISPVPTVTPENETDWSSYYNDYDYDGEYLKGDYLGSNHDADSILFDEWNEPMDYEFISISCEYNEEFGVMPEATMEEDLPNTVMVVAQPDSEGMVARRVLRLYLDQLDIMYAGRSVDHLLYRNGDADVRLNIEEILTGDVAKLARHLLLAGGEGIDPSMLDFEGMPSLEMEPLSADELCGSYIEITLAPIVMEDERLAWEIGVQLCTEPGAYCDISSLLEDFTVYLNVHGMFEEEEKDAFTAATTIALMDMEVSGEEILLDSELVIVPDEAPENMIHAAEYFDVTMPGAEDEFGYVSEFGEDEFGYDPEFEDDEFAEEAPAGVTVEYEASIPVEFYRHYALSCYYAGTGVYTLAETEAGADEFEIEFADSEEINAYEEFGVYDEPEIEAEMEETEEFSKLEELGIFNGIASIVAPGEIT